jgi:signal peptidase II
MLKNPTKPTVFAINLLVTIAILALDRWTKIAIEKALEIGQSLHLGSLFYFTLVHNHGGAFGILQNQKIIFISVGIAVITGILGYLYISKKTSYWMIAGLACVSAGALGNLYDRITLGYVIDFIDVHVWDYVFNVADVFIDIGFGAILIDMFLSGKEQKNK